MGKIFVVNPLIEEVGSEVMQALELEKVLTRAKTNNARRNKDEQVIQEKETLIHVHGRVIIKIDTQSKNFHTFESGLTIRRERQFNEFNRRITEPVNAILISGEDIPPYSEILISHNALHDSNRIFSYKPLSAASIDTDIKYFSIPDYECFAWRNINGSLQPMKNFEFALRVFTPYDGKLSDIEPTIIKDILYITTGELKGKVVHTLKASDYEIIYQDTNGREGNLIRIRHSEDDTFEREEVTAISHILTEKVNNGEILIGLTAQDAKKIR